MTDQHNTETAIVSTTATELAKNPSFEIPEGFINTFDLTTDEGKFSVLAALNGAEPLNDHVGEVLQVCDCITEPGIRKARDNRSEDTHCINTYLVTVDGMAYFSQSDGVARSVRMIAALWGDFGKSTELGYLNLCCIEKKLANGNTIKNIVPANA